MPDITANGINIHYEERGSGEPLILIMGLGADGSLWEHHVAAYSKHFRCIMPDNRGAGRSGKPKGPYTTRQMAEDTIGLMDALGISMAHLSGISMGGAVVQELAISYPSRVKSATVISSWPRCDAYTKRVFEMLESLVATSDPVAFNRLLQLWIFTPDYHARSMDDLLAREESGKHNPWPMPVEAFRAQSQACIHHDTLDRLGLIQAPFLITAGDQDIFTPMHYAETMAELIPGARLTVIQGGGHAHHWEKLDEFNNATLSFLLEHR